MPSEWPGALDLDLLGRSERRDVLEPTSASNISRETQRLTSIAACFLMDYEAGRPPTFPNDFDRIDSYQLRIFRIRFSGLWRYLGLYPATVLLFISYFDSRSWTVAAHLFAVAVLSADLYLGHQPYQLGGDRRTDKTEQMLRVGCPAFLVVLGGQIFLWPLLNNPETHISTLIASLFKPVVLFYLSRRTRDALEALVRIGNILFRVVLIELFLILVFAAVACRLYYNDENFQNLATAWLSLFQCKSNGLVLWIRCQVS